MKLLIIGLGSMGRRRINLLSKHFPDISLCGVDLSAERREQAAQLYHINIYFDLNAAFDKEKPDAALICTSPESHGNIILECIREGLHIFSEINLLQDQYEEIIEKARQGNKKLFLSSTMLYRKEIEIIKDCVLKEKTKVNYRYHVGQFLPDWHPWDHGRDFFVWNRRTNGCREILAIELPWIIKTFGKIKNFFVLKDNISSLNIEYPDNYIIVLEHDNGNKGVFLADIITRKAVRDLLVYSENIHIMWNGTPNSLCQYNIEKKSIENIETYSEIEKDSGYAEHIIENAYLDELKAFLDLFKDQHRKDREAKERYTFEEDLETLRLIDRIEGYEK